MSELIEMHSHPTLFDPVMVVALEGWIDAGSAAAGAMTSILETSDTEIIATFDTDSLLDHRARRPIMRLEEGHMAEVTWPTIELRLGVDANGRHVVLLAGAEPDHLWGKFCSEIVEVVEDLGVSNVIGLGAYPAAVPHTRPTRLALTSPSTAVMESHPGFVRGSIEVPAGIQAAIEMVVYDAGVPSMGLWAQIPHYISGVPYPAGSLALIEGIASVSGVVFPGGSLVDESATIRDRLDSLVGDNEQHRTMIESLEEISDAAVEVDVDDIGPLPTGDQIADELQAFLREQDG